MKAALYCRVSSVEQVDGFSLDAQIKALREYCFKNSIEIYEVYTDAGISGTKESRPAFQKMISEVHNFDIILVHKFDRFARKIELSHRIKEQLKKSKVNVVSISEPIEDSPIGFFQEGLLELLAEYFIKNLSKEVKKGHVERASQGLYNGSLPYGYKAVDGKLIINEEEAKIVRLIYDFHASGKGCVWISRYLQDNRILTRHGKQFQYFQVNRILHNPKYIGMIEYDGKLYEGQHEAIVTQEMFDRAQRDMKERNSNPNAGRKVQRSKNYEKFHLIDILYCGKCGGRMRIIYHHDKKSNWNAFAYVCSRAARYSGYCDCTKNYYAKDIEAEIKEMLEMFLRKKCDIQFETVTDETIIDVSENRKEKIIKELQRSKEAYLAEVFDLGEYKAIKERLEAELKDIKAEIKNTKKNTLSKKEISDKLKLIWDEYCDEQDVCRKREILKTVVGKIVLYPDKSVQFYFWV